MAAVLDNLTESLTLALPFGVPATEARLLLAVKLFEVGRVSLGQAAQVAGLPKRVFIDVLGQHGVPVINYPASELAAELDDLAPPRP